MELDVLVEIPMGSRNKYEMDHELGRIRLDRTLFTATQYPADYGFVRDTLDGDGEPLDALVLVEQPTFPGCGIAARPVALFWLRDERGPDAKLLCVPAHDPRQEALRDLDDVPAHLLREIGHFFDVYKELEPGKCVSVGGWEGRAAAERVTREAIERFQVAMR
ncbi:inorganic diphosphatase [Amycolatopsis taiwanensis]|uniref:Inorganic pyrophosphatase n=1 Tax=Amycolatopsis taiwanensis TaxID=342230 RepID=A0A9W6R2S3_9PSEU|nr:inorganic diphosphatase [Amycolatopsis taiwanensis]GLY66460.1 inorganic pyrophosphatase [Amycolatopsis taiwanensis]